MDYIGGDSENSIEDYFLCVLRGADVELEHHALIDVHVGKNKVSVEAICFLMFLNASVLEPKMTLVADTFGNFIKSMSHCHN